MTQFTVFETALGWAGIAWNAGGLAAVRLPSSDKARAEAGLLRRFPDAAPAEPLFHVKCVIADIQRLLRGERPDLREAVLDLSGTPDFDARVYELARAIPPGETRTYGEIATALGDRLLAREVGQALGRNPWPIVVPCHRVTAAGGKLGGFSAPGGRTTKLRLLAIEGAEAAAQADLFG
jgi:methylated-DNA-[protein]-cysteine S-methyltransferase